MAAIFTRFETYRTPLTIPEEALYRLFPDIEQLHGSEDYVTRELERALQIASIGMNCGAVARLHLRPWPSSDTISAMGVLHKASSSSSWLWYAARVAPARASIS